MPDLAYVCSFSSWTQTIILQLRCSAPQYQPRKASGAGCLSRWRHLNRDLLMLTNKNLHKYVLDMHFLECGTIKPNRVRNPSCLFGSQIQLVVTTFDGCSSICQTNLNSFQSDSIKVQLWNRFLFVFYGPPSRRKRCEVWHGRSGVWRERCGAIYYNQKEQKLTWEKNPTVFPLAIHGFSQWHVFLFMEMFFGWERNFWSWIRGLWLYAEMQRSGEGLNGRRQNELCTSPAHPPFPHY